MSKLKNIKTQFPIFKNNHGLVYLDSASTSQKPQKVIDSLVNFYTNYNANVHRGLYPIAERATFEYENSRKKIAKFINADPLEIIITGGTTNGINDISRSLYSTPLIPKNPKILLSDLEHHSNIIPWQQISGSEIDYIPLDSKFDFDITNIDFSKYDVISITHISNVTGTHLPNEIIKKIRIANPKAIFILDCAQSIGHIPIDVKDLGVDFITFSGHKLYGPTGVGVIWGKKEFLERMEPFNFGGGMIREVRKDKSSWAEIPEKFEAGTPPIAESIALATAIDFITEIGFEEIIEHETNLSKYVYESLSESKSIKIFHSNNSNSSVMSFFVEGVHSHDVSQFLGDHKVCVRAGHHCTQILHREVFDVNSSVRVSLGIYNTKEDIDQLIEALMECIKFYRR